MVNSCDDPSVMIVCSRQLAVLCTLYYSVWKPHPMLPLIWLNCLYGVWSPVYSSVWTTLLFTSSCMLLSGVRRLSSQTLDRFGSSVYVYYYGNIRVQDCENHSKGLLLWARAEANLNITAARDSSRKYSTYSAPTSRPIRIDFYQLVCNDWLL